MRHRIAGVEDKVGDRLLDLRAITDDRWERLVELHTNLNMIADQRVKQTANSEDKVVQRDGGRRQRYVAAKCDQLTRQLHRLLGHVYDLVKVFAGVAVLTKSLR